MLLLVLAGTGLAIWPLIQFIVVLFVVCVIIGAAYWLFGLIPNLPPFIRTVVTAILVIAGLIIVCYMLLSLVGLGGGGGSPLTR